MALPEGTPDSSINLRTRQYTLPQGTVLPLETAPAPSPAIQPSAPADGTGLGPRDAAGPGGPDPSTFSGLGSGGGMGRYCFTDEDSDEEELPCDVSSDSDESGKLGDRCALAPDTPDASAFSQLAPELEEDGVLFDAEDDTPLPPSLASSTSAPGMPHMVMAQGPWGAEQDATEADRQGPGTGAVEPSTASVSLPQGTVASPADPPPQPQHSAVWHHYDNDEEKASTSAAPLPNTELCPNQEQK